MKLSISDAIVTDFFRKYVELNEIEDPITCLKKNSKKAKGFFRKIPKGKLTFSYEEGKWTIKEILQHLIDTERVFTYRALTFSREDQGSLPGFDENIWAKNSDGNGRKWKDLLEEFWVVRMSTLALYRSLSPSQWLKRGTASSNSLNVIGLCFMTTGHLEHHLRIMEEKYLSKTSKKNRKSVARKSDKVAH